MVNQLLHKGGIFCMHSVWIGCKW